MPIAQDYGLPMKDGDSFTYRSRTFIPRELVEEEYEVGRLIRKRRNAPIKSVLQQSEETT